MGGASPYRARFVGSSSGGGSGGSSGGGPGGSSGKGSGEAPLGSNGEKFFGLVNVSNTCYANSVLQALYFCAPFRRMAIRHLSEEREDDSSGDSLLHSLSELFQQIDGQKRAVGSLAPRRFLARLRKANDLFSTTEHQDAHEFLQFLLNDIDENLTKRAKRQREKERQKQQGSSISSVQSAASAAAAMALGEDEDKEEEKEPRTWIQEIFQGFLVNQMKCLCCENVTVRREMFLDLSVDIEPHTSLAACLRAFESTELLRAGNKFFCDSCGCLQEAEKRHRIYQLPSVLTLHLKRFKYVERVGRCCRLPYRVVFPLQLRIVEHRPPQRHSPGRSFGVEEACESPENGSASPASQPPSRLFELRSVVVHIGRDLTRGHYVTVVRSGNRCVLLDDDVVREVEPEVLRSFYGTAGQDGQQGGQQAQQHSGRGWGGGDGELGSSNRAATSGERVASHSTATPLYERSPEGTCCGYLLFYEAVDGHGSPDSEPVATVDVGAGAAAEWISEDRNLDDSDASDVSREDAVSDAQRLGVPGANADDGELTQAFEQRCIPRGTVARQPPPHFGVLGATAPTAGASSAGASGAGATRPTALDWTSPSAGSNGAFAWTASASDEEGGRAPLPGNVSAPSDEGSVSPSRVNVVTVPTPSTSPTGGAPAATANGDPPPAASVGAEAVAG